MTEHTTMETQREIENAVAVMVEIILAEAKMDQYTNGYAKATGYLESLVSLAAMKCTEDKAQELLVAIRGRVSERQRDLLKQINNSNITFNAA